MELGGSVSLQQMPVFDSNSLAEAVFMLKLWAWLYLLEIIACWLEGIVSQIEKECLSRQLPYMVRIECVILKFPPLNIWKSLLLSCFSSHICITLQLIDRTYIKATPESILYYYWSRHTLHDVDKGHCGTYPRIPILTGAEMETLPTLSTKTRRQRRNRDLSPHTFWNSDETLVAVSELKNRRQGFYLPEWRDDQGRCSGPSSRIIF